MISTGTSYDVVYESLAILNQAHVRMRDDSMQFRCMMDCLQLCTKYRGTTASSMTAKKYVTDTQSSYGSIDFINFMPGGRGGRAATCPGVIATTPMFTSYMGL